MKVNAYHNGDDVFIAWKPDGFIPDCRGFALLRKRNGVEAVWKCPWLRVISVTRCVPRTEGGMSCPWRWCSTGL